MGPKKDQKRGEDKKRGKDKKRSKDKKRKGPLAEATERFLQQYTPKGDKRPGRPRERIFGWMAQIQDALYRGDDPETAYEWMVARRVRSTVFSLEGILKLYRKRYPDLETSFQRIKRLEDVLGVAEQKRDIVVKAAGDNLPAEVQTWLRHEAESAEDAAREEIALYWICDERARVPAFRALSAALLDEKWEKYKADRKTLRNEIQRRLKKAAAVPFDMTQLQGDVGLHELRRALRWFPIYAVAVDGLIAFHQEAHPVDVYAPLLDDPVAQSPFAQLPPPSREDNPLGVSQSLFLRNTQLIGELGDIKDSGEDVESYQHAFVAVSDMTADAAERAATTALGVPPDTPAQIAARAAELLDEVQANEILLHLAHGL